MSTISSITADNFRSVDHSPQLTLNCLKLLAHLLSSKTAANRALNTLARQVDQGQSLATAYALLPESLQNDLQIALPTTLDQLIKLSTLTTPDFFAQHYLSIVRDTLTVKDLQLATTLLQTLISAQTDIGYSTAIFKQAQLLLEQLNGNAGFINQLKFELDHKVSKFDPVDIGSWFAASIFGKITQLNALKAWAKPSIAYALGFGAEVTTLSATQAIKNHHNFADALVDNTIILGSVKIAQQLFHAKLHPIASLLGLRYGTELSYLVKGQTAPNSSALWASSIATTMHLELGNRLGSTFLGPAFANKMTALKTEIASREKINLDPTLKQIYQNLAGYLNYDPIHLFVPVGMGSHLSLKSVDGKPTSGTPQQGTWNPKVKELWRKTISGINKTNKLSPEVATTPLAAIRACINGSTENIVIIKLDGAIADIVALIRDLNIIKLKEAQKILEDGLIAFIINNKTVQVYNFIGDTIEIKDVSYSTFLSEYEGVTNKIPEHSYVVPDARLVAAPVSKHASWNPPANEVPNLPDFLKSIRKAKNLTRAQVIDLLKNRYGETINPQTLHNFENEVQFNTFVWIKRLAEIYDVSVNSIIEVSNHAHAKIYNASNPEAPLKSEDWQTGAYPIYFEIRHDLSKVAKLKQLDPHKTSLGWLLFAARKNPARYFSLRELSEFADGHALPLLIAYEYNRRNPRLDAVTLLSKAYGLSLEALARAIHATFNDGKLNLLAELFPDQTIFIHNDTTEWPKIMKYNESPGSMAHLMYAVRMTKAGFPTIGDLAKELGVPAARISWIENGKMIPTKNNIQLIKATFVALGLEPNIVDAFVNIPSNRVKGSTHVPR